MNQSPAQVARLFFLPSQLQLRFGAARLASLPSLLLCIPLSWCLAALFQARPEVSLKTALPRRNEREYITPQAFRQLLFSTFFVERRGACARELVDFCSSQRRRRAAKFLEITYA